MWKRTVIGASALMIAGSMMVYAQQRDSGDAGAQPRFGWREHGGMMGGRGGMIGRWRPSAADVKALSDARIAALHAGLELTPDQEKSWPPVEQALRDLAKLRADRLAARDQAQPPSGNPIERLQKRADALTARGTALKHLADAAAPLYQSLDEAQKQRLPMLARLVRPHDGHGGMWRGRFGRDGERGEFHHRFGDRFGDDHDMGGPHGMGRMHADEDEDYRGPL
jgi:zinc resistance-associated protein